MLGAPGDGTANVLHAEKGVLVVLAEQRIGKGPRSGRIPTTDEPVGFGAKLTRIMAESVLP